MKSDRTRIVIADGRSRESAAVLGSGARPQAFSDIAFHIDLPRTRELVSDRLEPQGRSDPHRELKRGLRMNLAGI